MSRLPIHLRFANWIARGVNRLGNAWNWLIGPVERLFGRIADNVLEAFDNFEALESVVFRLVSIIFWPFLALGKWLGSWIPSEGPFANLLSLPGRAIWYLGERIFGLAEKLNLDGVLLVLAKLLTPLWWPIATFFGFLNAWLSTRRPKELALAVPALLLAAPFAYIAIAGTTQSQGEIAESYKIAVRDALEAGDGATVSLFERKLAQLGVDTRRTDYRTAIGMAKNGDLASAYQRMQRLAPDDTPGYAASHVWIIQQLLSGNLTASEEPALQNETQRFLLSEQHLGHLDEMGIAGPGLAQMLAYIYSQTDRLPEAAKALQPYSNESLNAAAMRLRLLVALKQMKEARRQAKAVLLLINYDRKNSSLGLADHETRVLAAELVGDDQRLEVSLKNWVASGDKDSRPTELLAALQRRQFRRLLATGTSNPNRVVDLLCDAARLGSPHEWTALQISLVADQRKSSHNAQLIWEGLLTTPNAPSDVLELVGTVAATHGEILTARKVYERLLAEKDEHFFVWNNYAWVLLQEPEIDAPGALVAVNRALKDRPLDHRFRETRGQVYIKLKRWNEAVKDLEFALNGMPESPNIHRSLGDAYEALGQQQLAQIHREQATP